MFIHCQFFGLGEWQSNGFFPGLKGLKARRPPFALSIRNSDGGFQLFDEKNTCWRFFDALYCAGKKGEGVQITHLLFADDTLVFCEAKEDQLTHLCWLLMWFEALSGLKVNMEKSELIPIGRVENVGELADEYGYKVGNLPSTYLGMPLGAPFKSIGVWDGIEEIFRKRLTMWKCQYISKGGRITLIRSTLSNLSIYFMSIFHLPMAVRMKLEKIQRDFLWGGGSLKQKPHLVRWSIVCEDKSKGGLGVKSLGLFNKALLGKWSWRFANEKKSPLESDDQKEVRGGNWRMEIL